MWELIVARAFLDIGFAVDMRAKVNGTTPDLVVRRGGLNAMVEVFTIGDDDATRTEQHRLNAIAAELRTRLRFQGRAVCP